MRTKILCFPGARNSFWEQIGQSGDEALHEDKLGKTDTLGSVSCWKVPVASVGMTWLVYLRVCRRSEESASERSRTVEAASWLSPGDTRWRPSLDLAGQAGEPDQQRNRWKPVILLHCRCGVTPVRRSQFTRFYHGVDANTLFFGRESQDGKDNKSRHNTGPTVEQTEPETVPGGHGKLKTHCHCNNFSSDSNTHV